MSLIIESLFRFFMSVCHSKWFITPLFRYFLNIRDIRISGIHFTYTIANTLFPESLHVLAFPELSKDIYSSYSLYRGMWGHYFAFNLPLEKYYSYHTNQASCVSYRTIQFSSMYQKKY